MRERTQSILKTSIRDFINHGKPITSEYLYDHYDFGIKPAMIRWELNGLSDEGYFFQTHPSGGRFPTDKAYWFFIKDIMNNEEEKPTSRHKTLVQEFLSGERRLFIEELSHYLNALSIGYYEEAEEVYESGLGRLLHDLEVHKKHDLISIINDYESIMNHLGREIIKTSEWMNIYVGKSPFSQSDYTSIMIGNFTSPYSDFSLVVIGPKRMNYERCISLFKALKNLTYI